jgi:Ca-activated chloride channel family protein
MKTMAFLVGLIVGLAGCSTTESPEAEPVEGITSGPGKLEEVIVSGVRPGGVPSANRLASFAAMDMDAGALESVASDEEVWVIAKPSTSGQPATDEHSPGSGAMLTRLPSANGEIIEVPLPLEHTDVNASVNGYISSVNVKQRFGNPYDEKIEAVYMFPLPQDSAVSEFLMIIGERRIRGILREKEEARKIYEQARSQGYRATLLVQHRPNVFEQKVANIEPGKTIEVDIKYFNKLAYEDGWYSFVVPTVVGPRFNPPGSSDPIHALPRGEQTQSGNAVSYLRPNERSGHDISISVDINAGVRIEEFRASHPIRQVHENEEARLVTLARSATIPNKDFVLKFKVAGGTIKSNLLTWVDPASNQGYFTLMMYPPENISALRRQAVEMVFVLDCSGSMRGRPLDQAKAAVSAALDMLREDDTFQIIRFSDNSSQFGSVPVRATRQNKAMARTYLRSLNGSGGTMMIEGVKTALEFPHDPERLRFVSFMTDGYIGNEVEIIGAVHERIGESRIFSFGVGSSVNRYLLERMAKEGRGAVAYLGPQDSGKDVMSSFFDRISHPALTDLNIDWGGMSVTDVYPARVPDMFVGRPVFITGKFLGAPGEVSVSGRAAGETHRFSVDTGNAASGEAMLAKIWARLRIADLADRRAWQPDPHGEIAIDIRDTALQYQLMSAYTSFVAVDSSYRTAGDHGTTVHQAVPVPDGVRYDTTVE